MKQRFIRKNQQVRYIRPARPMPSVSVDASDGKIKKDNNTKNSKKEDMVDVEEVMDIVEEKVEQKKPTKKNTDKPAPKKVTAKKPDGLMERVDVTYVADDGRTILND